MADDSQLKWALVADDFRAWIQENAESPHSGEVDMEDRLEQVLSRVIDWVKYEEAKNAALITFNGVGVGVILQWWSGSGVSASLVPWLRGSLAALLISLLLALLSFYPVRRGEKLHRCIARWRGRLTADTGWKSNILFFDDIAGTAPQIYLNEFRTTVDTTHELEMAYAREIVANSEIAFLKLRIFESASVLSFFGYLVMCGASFVHSFNK